MNEVFEALFHGGAWNSPGLTFALALGAGVMAQILAHHLKLPGIVLFLATGVLLGPDVLNIVRPESLGTGLETLVGLGVAVILFEGGLNLNIGRLRSEARTIRRLVTIGALITATGGAVAARLLMGWDWRTSIIFGTLVIVTGPTVIAPLVRRIRVNSRLQTILEAEGVLIDPIGAIIAVVTLEVLLSGTAGSAAVGLLGIPSRLLVGLVLGVVGGVAIGWVLGRERLVPDNIQNVFTLSLVLAFYALSEAILPESGILAAPIAGLVVSNMRVRVPIELMEFKEELTIMLVGLLFVLLAADVALADVQALGWAGLATIAVLMFVVRPLDVAICTAGSEVSYRERSFIAWLGPRGIVAAAVASIFAVEVEAAGLEGGGELRALVFLTIAVTVVIQGLSGGWIATVLGVKRRKDVGYAMVGANSLARALAAELRAGGTEVILIDSNAQETNTATSAGFEVVYGNANEERTLLRADIEGRRGFITLTNNEGANLLLANRSKEVTRAPRSLVCVARGKPGVQETQVTDLGYGILFGRPIEIGQWIQALRTESADVQHWRFDGDDEDVARETLTGREWTDSQFVALALHDKRGATPIDNRTAIRTGDTVAFLTRVDQKIRVAEHFTESGWTRVDDAAGVPEGPVPAGALPDRSGPDGGSEGDS